MKAFDPVPRPAGTRTSKNKNGSTYVQVTVEKRYDPTTQYNNDKRVLVGKMVDGSDSMMIPNERFFDFFPDLAPVSQAPDCSDALKIGPFVLIDHILEESGLASLIDEVYEENADLMKDIVAYRIVKETSVMQHFPEYGFDHPLFSRHLYSDNRISEILSGMTQAQHDLFLEKWNQRHCDAEGIYISYDSTNMNSAAMGAELIEYGKSKDQGSDLPQINVSIGFDQEHCTPLFYELYPGSIVDNSQCRLMIDKVKRYGYKKIGFIIDRGYFSIENLKYFEKNGYEYLIMAKIGTKFVQKAYQEVQYKLRLDPENYIQEHEVQGLTVRSDFGQEQAKERYIHVYYDDVRGAMERKAMLKKFKRLDENLEKLCEKKTTRKFEAKKYEGYYHLKLNGEYLISYSRKSAEIKAKIDQCGYFALITSKPMSAAEALTKYRFRDTSEKLFMTDKTFLDSDTIRVQSDEAIESKQMISFLALVVRNEIFNKTKKLKIEDRKKFTIPAILRELNKMIITRDSQGKFTRRYALTSTQKKILEPFDLSEKKVKSSATALCKELSV